MAVTENKMIKDFVDAIKTGTKEKTKAYESPATVTRIENGVAWVHVPGGVEETPVQLTIAASEGDQVRVRVANGRATIVGNVTSPPTDDRTAREALYNANVANLSARSAEASASAAKQYAEVAKQTTDEINAYADTVGKTVTQVLEDGETAGEAAQQAKDSADSAKQSADTAFKQLSVVEDIVGVLDLIAKNGDYDRTQDTEVVPDKWYFERTGTDPDYVYNVVTVPTTYALTTDTDIDPNKTYYTRSGTAPDYEYTPVENPVVEDIGTYYEAHKDPTGLYELTGIDESIQNYVSSHLALDNEGLWLQLDQSSTKVLLSATEGVVMYDNKGHEIAKYGETTQIGNGDDFHIKLGIWYALTKDIAVVTGKTYYTRTGDSSTGYAYTEVENPVTADIGTYYEKMPAELGFYKGEYKIAYMSGQKLYIPQSVVLQQMDVGLPYGYIDPATQEQIGFGQWSWKLHLNNENPPRHNLNLKWIG